MAASTRETRDERIRELDRAKWSLRAIAREIHLSAEQVRRILAAQDVERALVRSLRRAEILADLLGIHSRISVNLARQSQLKRELRLLDEELEAAELDRLLGLL